MFDKYTSFQISSRDWEVLDSELVKTAAFNLPQGIVYDPDFLYMRVRGVSAGEFFGPNKNQDFFPQEELKKAYQTFLNAHAFKNHENKDVANAIGDVLSAEWDDKMKGVMLVIRIDRRIAPTVVRGFEKGFMTDVSMGCRVDHVICSYCGQKAKTQREYCVHLQTMKGKIFDDGKRVYEINIGPRFHDISAVLNGAEKVAKVSNIYICNNKVALRVSEEEFAKVAWQAEDPAEPVLEKVASLAQDFDLSFDDNALSKHSWREKVAEIKKDIQAQIVGISHRNLLTDKLVHADENRAIFRLMGEQYWGDAQCAMIASKVWAAGKKHGLGTISTLLRFLDLLDFVGIELSPLEFGRISQPFVGLMSRNPDSVGAQINPVEFMSKVDQAVDGAAMPAADLNMVLSAVKNNLAPNLGSFAQKVIGLDKPVLRTKIIIAKLHHPDDAPVSEAADSDLMRAISPLIPGRSLHTRFFMPRVRAMQLGTPATGQFLPSLMDDTAKVTAPDGFGDLLRAIMYAAYQQHREQHLASDSYFQGTEKFAAYIDGESLANCFNDVGLEKEAWKQSKRVRYPMKARMISLPIVYGYSGLQRARMNNGENISSLNRYVAENPENAWLIQAIVAPEVYRYGRHAASSVLANGGRALNKAIDLSSKLYVKTAGELYEGDLFKDVSIEAALRDKYSEQQQSILKTATILYRTGNQSGADEIMVEAGLVSGDIDEYLQSIGDCLKIKIDENLKKQASANLDFSATGKRVPPELLTDLAFVYANDKFRCTPS